jgi:uncharacterized secreted protein with C-terminal beta-propeller domain
MAKILINIDDKKLVVIGQKYTYSEDTGVKKQLVEPNISIIDSKMIYLPERITTKVYIYNIEDKESIKEERNFEIEGSYTSSRKIDNNLYIISDKNMRKYHYFGNKRLLDDINAPVYSDSVEGVDKKEISYDCMYYFPGSISKTSLNIVSLDISKVNSKLNIKSYLGNGENIYCSQDSLYVTYKDYSPIVIVEGNNKTYKKQNTREWVERTGVYRFALNGESVIYQAKGEVKGSILNQFSMDEYNNHFRIATTQSGSTNNIYVMNEDLNITDQINKIAEGEKIYSVRFMGERGYIVTFKLVDPLIVLGLKDPKNISILGQLKIPGYSNYLHPVDENHIIGFGKDAIEVDGRAYYMGMKIALFDVSDVKNPVQKFSEEIGDRGTDSEILNNHKALLYSQSNKILAFPINVCKLSGEKYDNYGLPAYGKKEFQGAYIYKFGIDSGFELQSKITHIDSNNYSKGKEVSRIMYIDNVLYTISEDMILASDMDGYKELKRVYLDN